MTMQIFSVGGAIRDALLHQSVKDKDWVVVGATPEQMTQLDAKQHLATKALWSMPHPKSR